MNVQAITDSMNRTINGPAARLPLWGIKMVLRLGQISKPGTYGLVFMVRPDGRRALVIERGKIEELGK